MAMLAWPASRWIGGIPDLAAPHRLVVPALANAVILLGGYLGVASLVWGFADALMDQPRDLSVFDQPPRDGRSWRVAHLSDLHVVGERYGFRIESGRSGPRGNERLTRMLTHLDAIHAERPVDLVLITGDATDAGRWAEFFTVLTSHPELARRTLLLPGNHDVNIVDRANPARLNLPLSPGLRLRQMRTLSVIAAVQGDRVRLVDPATRRLGDTLSRALAPQHSAIAAFADTGALRLSARLARVWAGSFPMVLPPETEEGLGVVPINSTAETHFSFTNALGLVSVVDKRRIAGAQRLAAAALAPHAPVRQRSIVEIVLAAIDGRTREAGDAGDHLERTATRRLHLARRPQPPTTLVQLGAYPLPSLPDAILVNLVNHVDHVDAIRLFAPRRNPPEFNPSRPPIAIRLPLRASLCQSMCRWA